MQGATELDLNRLLTGLPPVNEIALAKKKLLKADDEKKSSIFATVFNIFVGMMSVCGMAFMAFLFAQEALVGLGILIGATVALAPFTWLTLGFCALLTWIMFSAYATTFGMNMILPYKEKQEYPAATAP